MVPELPQDAEGMGSDADPAADGEIEWYEPEDEEPFAYTSSRSTDESDGVPTGDTGTGTDTGPESGADMVVAGGTAEDQGADDAGGHRDPSMTGWVPHDERHPDALDADERMAALFARVRSDPQDGEPAPSSDSYWRTPPPTARPPTSWSAPATMAPARSGRGRALLLVAIVVVVLIGAGIAVYTVHTSSAPPQNAVEQAVATSVQSKTADLALAMTIDAGAHLTITGNGDINLVTNASNLTLSYEAGGQTLAERAVQNGSMEYYNLGPIVAYVAPGKSWVSQNTGQGGSGTSGVGAGGIFSNPGALLAVLKAEGTSITRLGPSTVDGAAVQGYSIDVSQAGIRKVIASTAVPPYLKAELSEIHYTKLDYGIYVDDTHHLKEVRGTGAFTLEGETFGVSSTMDFSNYGTPVSVVDPPASEVIPYQQFQKIVSQDQGDSST